MTEARRRIFVGDLQGCCDELEALLEKLRFDSARDELHPVGDLVNRGPRSLETLRTLRSLDAGGVLGNHDLHLLQAAAGRRALRPRDTLAEILKAPDREALLAWLAARPFVRCWPDVTLVHAGLHPHWIDPARTLADADPMSPSAAARFAVTVRYCSGIGGLPGEDGGLSGEDGEGPGAPFRPWFEHPAPAGRARTTVVFGHWAARGRVELPGVRGLDTGCVWGGQLTAWIAEEDRFVSVPARRTYLEPTP